jgi:putative iron-regulated protein
MARMVKTWTTLGLTASIIVGTATAATVGPDGHRTAKPADKFIHLIANSEGGSEGEGGGLGDVTSYALNSTDPNAYAYDATAQIDAHIDLVHDSYEKSVVSAQKLDDAVTAMLADPSAATLAAARDAWIAARPDYLKTEAFRFYGGPIDAVEGFINSWPMNEAFIDYVDGKPDAGLVNDASFVIGDQDVRGKNQGDDDANVTTGWHAIEFLLWGQDLSTDGPGNRPYTDYIAGAGNADRRRAYLKTVTASLVEDLDGLADTWDVTEDKSFAAALKKDKPREVIGRMVNGMAILAGYEFMSERLAVALDSGDQEDEHSCFSDNTKNDFVYDLVGIKQVWTGDTGDVERTGLNDLVRKLDPATADKIDLLLADAETKIAALGSPWDQVLAKPKGSPERVAAEDVVAALQALGNGLKDAGKTLGVLVLIPTG